MDIFVARHASLVTSTLSGFDRLVFRGHLLPLMQDGGMFRFLSRAGVQLLDFKDFVLKTSERVKKAALAPAERLGRPVRYLSRSLVLGPWSCCVNVGAPAFSRFIGYHSTSFLLFDAPSLIRRSGRANG